MTTPRRLLPCQPVVLVHVEDPPQSGLAACCGEPFRVPGDDQYPGVGRQACPGCVIRMQQAKLDVVTRILKPWTVR